MVTREIHVVDVTISSNTQDPDGLSFRLSLLLEDKSTIVMTCPKFPYLELARDADRKGRWKEGGDNPPLELRGASQGQLHTVFVLSATLARSFFAQILKMTELPS